MKKALVGLGLGWILLAGGAHADDKGIKPIKEVFEPKGEFDPKKYAKVAVVQWASSSDTPLDVSEKEAEAFKQRNRAALEEYIREAAKRGAKLVITPEFAVVGYPNIPDLPPEEDQFQSREQVEPYVETVDGRSFKFFSKLAKELEVGIHYGFAEVDSKTDKYYNTVVAINAKGEKVAVYRKIHLFKDETKFLEEGKKPVTYQSPVGKIGIAICSDIYSETPMDNYREAEVAAVALSTSWAQWNTGMDHFKDGARWADAYVLAANQNYFPDSGVVNPDGTTQSHIRQTDGIAYGYLPWAKK